MSDEETRPDFREGFFKEADQLHAQLLPLAELMRKHPSVVRQIMKTEHLILSVAERVCLLGRTPT